MTLLVCGLGRCGSSLVMQMLEAGGYPVLGDFPAYEPSEVGMDRSMTSILSTNKALKLLDPHRTPWKSTVPWKAIWLTRDHKQQAKSQVKFVQLVGGFSSISSHAWKAIAKSLSSEEQECLRLLKPMPLVKISFEEILANPFSAANTIQAFISEPLNIEKMAACVIKRAARCQPRLDIENTLIDARAREEKREQK